MPNDKTPEQELAAYRAMHAAVQAEYDRAAEKMTALKAQGRKRPPPIASCLPAS